MVNMDSVDLKESTNELKKTANTILSPHLEALSSGSMLIEFDNMQTAHQLGEPLCGRLKIYLQDDFEAKNITINLFGYVRSHFSEKTRLAKTLIDIDY